MADNKLTRLDILKNSLAKKEMDFDAKFASHITDVQ